MRLLALIVALLSLTIAACSKPPAVPQPQCLRYLPGSAFTLDELIAVEEAVDVWRDSGACVLYGKGGVTLMRATTAADVPQEFWWTVHEKGAVAFYSEQRKEIWVIANRVGYGTTGSELDMYWRNMWVHEFGHAMGAEHVNMLTSCLFGALHSWCAINGKVLEQDIASIRPWYLRRWYLRLHQRQEGGGTK